MIQAIRQEQRFATLGRAYRASVSAHDIAAGNSRVGDVRVVEADGTTAPLAPRLELRNHSPTGFAWGYLGSGPAQLALALLAHAFDDDVLALALYQRFKADVIARLRGGDWQLPGQAVLDWLDRQDVDPERLERLRAAQSLAHGEDCSCPDCNPHPGDVL